VEVAHQLVDDGVADGAGCVFGREYDDAFTFDEPRMESCARGPGWEVGREPGGDVLNLRLQRSGLVLQP